MLGMALAMPLCSKRAGFGRSSPRSGFRHPLCGSCPTCAPCPLAHPSTFSAPSRAANTVCHTSCATHERNRHLSGIVCQLTACVCFLLWFRQRFRPNPPPTMRPSHHMPLHSASRNRHTGMLAVAHGSHVPLHGLVSAAGPANSLCPLHTASLSSTLLPAQQH